MAASRKNLRYCNVLHAGKYYDIMVAVDTLDQVDDILQAWALEELADTLDLPEELLINKDITEVLTTLDIDSFAYVSAPVSKYMDLPRYSGISGDYPTLPTALNGSSLYVMPAIMVFLNSEVDFSGYFGEYSVATASLALSAGLNYIGVTFNAGTPIFQAYTSHTSFNYSSIIPVAAVLSFGGAIYNIPLGETGYGLPEKLRKLNTLLQPFEIVGSFTLTATDLYVQLSAMSVSNGVEVISALAVDTESSLNDMYQYYLDGSSVWQSTKVTQLSNSQYQSSGGLASLSPGEYVVHNLYRVMDAAKLLIFTVPSNKFTSLQNALNSEEIVTIPDAVKNTAVLVGRAIVGQAENTAVIQKVQRSAFGVSA